MSTKKRKDNLGTINKMSALTAELLFTFGNWLIILRNIQLPLLTQYVVQVLNYSIPLEAKYNMGNCKSFKDFLWNKETRFTFSTNFRLMVYWLARMGLGMHVVHYSTLALYLRMASRTWLHYLYNRRTGGILQARK